MTSTIVQPKKTPVTPPPAKAPKSGALWSTMLQIICWQVIAVLFVEFALFCAGLGEEEIFKLDPVLGSTHLTNKRVTWRSEGYSVSWFNEAGMRESGLTVAKPAGVLRVALLGDSLTESLQVPLERTFGKLMEQMLCHDLNKTIQVLNFGVSGYSTAQEYLLLKNKVLKYRPDVVLVCYNSRDSFENWSAPDQVITNVRPYALHLPGGKLTIDTSPVTNWMKSPRAKFLQQSEWLRQNSRLWGLFAALELDWSMHNETYKYVSLLLTRPGKGIKEISKRLQLEARKSLPWLFPSPSAVASKSAKDGPTTSSSNVSKEKSENAAKDSGNLSVEQNASHSTTQSPEAGHPAGSSPEGSAGVKPASASTSMQKSVAVVTTVATATRGVIPSKRSKGLVATNDKSPGEKTGSTVEAKAPSSTTTVKSEPGSAPGVTVDSAKKRERPVYQQFIMRSLGSLLEEMEKETKNATNGKFALIAMPVRSALCPAEGIDTAFNDFTYKDEVAMLREICADKKIAMLDLEKPAESFPFQTRKDMFYAVHLTAPGHVYVAELLTKFVEPYLRERADGSDR